MTYDIEQAQRRDIETALGRVSLGLDTENVSANPYIYVPSSFVGNAWFQQGEKIVKLNITEDDSLSFVVSALDSLEYKNVTNVIVSFDYEVTNVKINYPTLVNISFASSDLTSYKSCETILTTQGHIEVDCSLFDFSADIINNAITEQGFCIGLNFKGDKSNATVKISNVTFGFKYTNLLQDESDSVVNRLNPQIDFWRDGEKLYLQIGDGTGKGRIDREEIDTYTKDEIDNKLATKVNIEIGKGLSSQDYSLQDKLKLMNIESNANNYVHPVTHLSSIIQEEFALTNLETSENATQHEINLAIDDKIGNVGGSVDWDDIVDKPSDFPPSVHNHDDRYYTESEVDTALSLKQATLISGTNIKTINNTSLLGSGNITIQGGGTGVDIATSWGNPTSDSKVPSEKLAKDTFDSKANNTHSHSTSDITGLIDLVYPVGSIYMSVNNTSPSVLFGGTWQQLTDTFLYASTSADTNSTTATGGEATHSLTQSEMPRHTHTQNGHSHSPSGDYDYFLATPTNGGAVTRNSTAGQTGTKVQNLLQSSSGVARTNTDTSTPTIKYTGGSGTSQSASNGSAHNNMPPYMKVFMWKRTA